VEILQGDIKSLDEKNKVLISDELAELLFEDENPIGQLITAYLRDGSPKGMMVGAVYKRFPENSSLQCDVINQMDNYIEINEIDEFNWKSWIAATFLHIPDKNNVDQIEKDLRKYVPVQNDAREDFQVASFFIEPLSDIPTTHRDYWSNWLNSGLHPAALVAPPIMAFLLLLLACLNFMNTALATSKSRLKEIGVRKVMGSIRRHTIIQFLGENIVICFFASLVSLLIGSFLIDAYSDMWPGMTLKIDFTGSLEFWGFMFGLLVLTAILAGAYPAFYISRFNPVNILKGDVKYSGAGWVSKVLLGLQFVIAMLAITSAVIFIQNAHYQNNLYMGYEKDQVIAIPVNDNSELEGFKNKIIQNPLITSLGVSEEHIGWGSYVRTLKYGAEVEQEVTMMDIGRGYTKTMGLQLIAGEDFDKNFKESYRGRAIIVNEKFIEDFKWKDEDPINKKVRLNDTTELIIVGLVKNFYQYGFWEKINPTAITLGRKDRMRMIVVQAEIQNLEPLNDQLKEVWAELIPNRPYPGFFQEERLAEAKDVNNQIVKIYNFLAIVSVLLSLVGLYTLVSLTIIKRTKEIGIRKVLGAPISNLLKIINRDFIIIIIIASAIGSYGGYMVSVSLMSSIWVYHMDPTIFTFLIPIVFIIGVSAITLTRKVYKAASKNPVDAIKYE
jgi:ABC-type antimicrobial peptide transport system permease subunit